MNIVNLNTVIANVFAAEGTQEISMTVTSKGVALSNGAGTDVNITQVTQLDVAEKGVANIPNGSYKLTVVDGKVMDMVQVTTAKKAAVEKAVPPEATNKRSGCAHNPKFARD